MEWERIATEIRNARKLNHGHAHDSNRRHRHQVKTIRVKVKPNARLSELEEAADGFWLAKLKSPPTDGKANAELVALVAKRFGCSKSAVSIKSGASARMKLVQIEGL